MENEKDRGREKETLIKGKNVYACPLIGQNGQPRAAIAAAGHCFAEEKRDRNKCRQK